MGKIVVKVQEEKHLGEDKIYHLMIGVKEVYLYFKNDRNAKQYANANSKVPCVERQSGCRKKIS